MAKKKAKKNTSKAKPKQVTLQETLLPAFEQYVNKPLEKAVIMSKGIHEKIQKNEYTTTQQFLDDLALVMETTKELSQCASHLTSSSTYETKEQEQQAEDKNLDPFLNSEQKDVAKPASENVKEEEKPILTLSNGTKVMSLGSIVSSVNADKYQRLHKGAPVHPFTAGFHVKTMIQDLPASLKIVETETGPLFTIDAKNESLEGTSLSRVCTKFCKKFDLQKINGPDAFGFNDIQLQTALNELNKASESKKRKREEGSMEDGEEEQLPPKRRRILRERKNKSEADNMNLEGNDYNEEDDKDFEPNAASTSEDTVDDDDDNDEEFDPYGIDDDDSVPAEPAKIIISSPPPASVKPIIKTPEKKKERRSVSFSPDVRDDSSKEEIPCPICDRRFSKYQITSHLKMRHFTGEEGALYNKKQRLLYTKKATDEIAKINKQRNAKFFQQSNVALSKATKKKK